MSSTSATSEIITIKELSFQPLIREEEIQAGVRILADEISSKTELHNAVCVAVLNGAFIFAADLLRALKFAPEVSFLKVSSYQQLSSTGKVRETIGLEMDITGRNVLLIEDIIDTGHTIAYLHQMLKERGAADIHIATLLMKPEAYLYDIPVQYVAFPIPNKFVIGYGLDYDGFGRTLRDIYVLK
jgi:hypoxanthine phosphoribosyltransferase